MNHVNQSFSNLSKPDIVAVIENNGIEMKRRGRDFWACCPFHADKTPSFKVSPERQAFYCFGCGEGGDVISFIQKHHNLTFKEAIVHLGIRPGRPVPIDPAREKQRELKKAFESWRLSYYWQLCDRFIEINALRGAAERKNLTEDQGFYMAERLSELPLIAWQMDILTGNDEQAKLNLLGMMIQ